MYVTSSSIRAICFFKDHDRGQQQRKDTLSNIDCLFLKTDIVI